jgi:hypothetical protein
MKRDGRWDSQKKLVDRIARIATRILPDGEGVFLRFINQNVTDDSNLTLEMIAGVLDSITAPSGDTPIGTSLKDKILTPLVYSKLESKTLERPLLVSIITDGMPDGEHKTCLEETIAECGVALEKNGYPRGSTHPSPSTLLTETLTDDHTYSCAILDRADRQRKDGYQIFGTSQEQQGDLRRSAYHYWYAALHKDVSFPYANTFCYISQINWTQS